MALITIERVSANLIDVTPEQIGCCHAVFGPDNKKFYQVENSKGLLDEAGNLIEYIVRYSREHGFTCTCPSGRYGFANVKHPSGVCWHVRASVAAAIEERQALHALVVVEAKADEPINVLIVEKPMSTQERRDDHRYNGGRAYGLQQLAEMRCMTNEIFHK